MMMMRAICMNNLRCNSVLASRVSMPMRFSTTAVSNEKNKDIANEKSHVFDVTSSNFQDLVLGSSTLVLLDCYANWCPPCRKLGPILEKVVSETNGKARMGKLNVDDEIQLAVNLKVSNIPVIFAVGHGKLLDRKVGLDTPQNLKAWIDDLIKKNEEVAKEIKEESKQ